MLIFLLKSLRPILEISTPSINSCPSNSFNLNNNDINELLPAPVLPTIPIYKSVYLFKFSKELL